MHPLESFLREDELYGVQYVVDIVLGDDERRLKCHNITADTVLTGDLAEYEIVPRLRSFAKASTPQMCGGK